MGYCCSTWVVVNVDIVDRFSRLVCLVKGGVIAGGAADEAGGGAGGVRLEVRLEVARHAGTSASSADGVRAGPAVWATPHHPGLAAAWKHGSFLAKIIFSWQGKGGVSSRN